VQQSGVGREEKNNRDAEELPTYIAAKRDATKIPF
jgi:hypothetical protein